VEGGTLAQAETLIKQYDLNTVSWLSLTIYMRLGLSLFVGGVLISFIRGLRLKGLWYLFWGVFLSLFGLAFPGLINWLLASAIEAHTNQFIEVIRYGSYIALGLGTILTVWYMLYPILRSSRVSTNKALVILMVVLSVFFAPAWGIALLLVLRPDAERNNQ
jgi:hypothetical protein